MDANAEAEQTHQQDQLHQQLRQYFKLFQGGQHTKPLTSADIAHLVHSNIVFKDPFQRINGPDALCRLLNHFHQSVTDARFLIEAVFEHPEHDKLHNRHYLVKWRFSGHLDTIGLWEFPGVSEIEQDEEGRITHHTDFWDAGEHFYEKLPFFGRITGWIKAKVANAGKG
ncbi:nuclear transport factor 2 family protein [Oceanospirillum sp.]|uniref:nuclear transport factor 2 family protein n=1 Tax=Oceanospirillum sp. TaxID=2021254 RepID=UPI003A95092D